MGEQRFVGALHRVSTQHGVGEQFRVSELRRVGVTRVLQSAVGYRAFVGFDVDGWRYLVATRCLIDFSAKKRRK